MAKPVLLVTRRLPAAVEARAARDYDARLNPRIYYATAPGSCVCPRAAALLCCPEDRLDAETSMALPDTVQVIATFSVGYDHVAVEAAGLDVYDGEPIVNPGYLGLQNVVLFAASRQRHGGDPRRYGLSGARRHRCGVGRPYAGQRNRLRRKPLKMPCAPSRSNADRVMRVTASPTTYFAR
jgi:hypothetical protein